MQNPTGFAANAQESPQRGNSLGARLRISSLFNLPEKNSGPVKKTLEFYNALQFLNDKGNSRIEFAHSPGFPPLTFFLGRDGKTVDKIWADSPDQLVAGLSELKKRGFLKPGLNELGIYGSEERARAGRFGRFVSSRHEEDKRTSLWIREKNKAGIAGMAKIGGLASERIFYAPQHGAAIIREPGKNDAIYASYAANCVIPIFIARKKNDFSGDERITAIASAHIDSGVSEGSIREFYKKFEESAGKGADVEIFLVSGSMENLLKAVNAVPRENIKGVHSELEGPFFIEGAAVSGDGGIYYGQTQSLVYSSKYEQPDISLPWLGIREYPGANLKKE